MPRPEKINLSLRLVISGRNYSIIMGERFQNYSLIQDFKADFQ